MILIEFGYCKIMGMVPFERKKHESTFILDIVKQQKFVCVPMERA